MKTLALALASAALVAGAIVQSPVLAQAVEVPARAVPIATPEPAKNELRKAWVTSSEHALLLL